MALNSVFGGKREGDSFNPRPTPTSGGVTPGGSSPVSSVAVPSSLSNAAAPVAAPVKEESGAKLTVGPNIKLRGVEITDCDTLVVEGTVEATMDSRVIQISEQGAFKGSANIDIAEIRGEFDGDLTVRDKLVIFATGKVTGKIRYGKLVIEEGGQVSGEISSDTHAKSAKPADKDAKPAAAAPAPAPAAASLS
ncbi:cell shape determination protein CcmA [Comamonas serinivorans]|uniref:Cell shape determination protein CcmA n=1 Tax=Comamonas serinivorans TaxID=1082851 RepID=A0A1Y0EIF2_9BURK|nr:polymer-forming cytoskeletal protein [Comamonas serinivorans]ARU03376.1 cell shape determination protein CcmA [Comamonas serinivorans]